MKFCTYCSKSWGDLVVGAEVVLTRCPEHVGKMNSKETISKGQTAGMIKRTERRKARRLARLTIGNEVGNGRSKVG